MSFLYLREDFLETEIGSDLSILDAEAKHAVAVNRTRIGDNVLIGNGRGLIVGGVVTEAKPHQLTIKVLEKNFYPKNAPSITLVQALAKGDRDERSVQSSTELGVDRIIPWSAARSVSKWDENKKSKGKLRWQTIAREATKQSIRAWQPEVQALASTADLIVLAGSAKMFILDPYAETTLSASSFAAEEIVLVVGPEGGFSDREIQSLVAAGAQNVSLGKNVLRTSTAGPAAISAINTLLGRW